MRRLRRAAALTSAALVIGSLLAGCANKKENSITTSPMEADVFQIIKFYPAQMWQRRRVDDLNPNGFVVTVYLISGKTQKGAFGDGTIHVDMHVAQYDKAGMKTFVPAYSWSLDPDQALPYRVIKEGAIGWGYMLHLFWPDDVDVLGKEVSLTISYTRSDGRVIRSRPHHHRVPIYDVDAYRADQAARAKQQKSTESQPTKEN